MKLRSGKEIKQLVEVSHSDKSQDKVFPTLLFSAICGIYAGILAFIFVNSGMCRPITSNLEIFINSSLEIMMKEITDIGVFLVTIFTRLNFHFSKWFLDWITMFVDYSVYSVYGIDSMQCLSNYSNH